MRFTGAPSTSSCAFLVETKGYAEMETGATTLAFASNRFAAMHLPRRFARATPTSPAPGFTISFLSENVQSDYDRGSPRARRPSPRQRRRRGGRPSRTCAIPTACSSRSRPLWEAASRCPRRSSSPTRAASTPRQPRSGCRRSAATTSSACWSTSATSATSRAPNGAPARQARRIRCRRARGLPALLRVPGVGRDAVYEGAYPLATALGRPLIAKAARRQGARGRRGGGRPRLHGQGQRPGAFRRRLARGSRPTPYRRDARRTSGRATRRWSTAAATASPSSRRARRRSRSTRTSGGAPSRPACSRTRG